MRLSTADLHELADAAIAAACEAGQMIASSRPTEVRHKTGGASLASQVVTEIDRRSEDIILASLEPTMTRFELGLLTEEQDDDGGRLSADYFWCVDPLDGTLPFIEGTPGYAVSIALVGRDGTPWIGVVYDPVETSLFHAISGQGAFLNHQAWPLKTQPRGEDLTVFADRSLVAGDDHEAVVEHLRRIAQEAGLAGVRLDTTGGAVMNACRVLANPPACYFKYPGPSGGGSLWDFAATACLFREAGAVATDMYGAPLDLNRADSSFMNHRGVLYATDEVLAQRIQATHQPSG